MKGPAEGSRFASIDLGSHTVRMMVAELLPSLRVRPVLMDRKITRLATGFTREGVLAHAPAATSRDVIREYVRRGRELGVSAFSCGATGVVRRAANGAEFLREVARDTGIAPFVASEELEARLSAKGILSVLTTPCDLVLTFDLGGSSTEFVLLDRRRSDPLWSTSLFIGAATLTERFLGEDPPGMSAVREAEAAARELVDPVLATVSDLIEKECGNAPWMLVGTAGTVTTLASMALEMERYDPYRVNNFALEASWVSDLVRDFSTRSLSSRRGVRGLERGREDIILGGAVVVGAILGASAKSDLLVTDAGFLEGLLLDLIERESELQAGLSSPFGWLM